MANEDTSSGAHAFSACTPDATLDLGPVSSEWQPFWLGLEHYGSRVALVSEEGEEFSYTALCELADRAGFQELDRRLVLLEMDNIVAATAAFLGALRANHAVILASPDKSEARQDLIETYRSGAVWTLDGGLEVIGRGQDEDLHPDLAVLLSTSGSTGSAKLVRLSAYNVDQNARSIRQFLAIGADDRAATTLVPTYSYGLSVLNSHLAAGASVALTNMSVTDQGFAAFLAERDVTSMAGVPYTYELLIASGLIDRLPPSVRKLTQAGGRLAPDLVERVRSAAEREGRSFYVMYGQTEATARMAYMPPKLLTQYPDCIGRAIPGGMFELVDADTGLPADTLGELVFSGPNVMMGYAVSRADLSKPAEIDRLYTGDLAERVAPDIYRIIGRKSRFIKLFGLRIGLDEVEQEAARQQQASVIATGDDQHLVLASDDPDCGLDELATALAKKYGLPEGAIVCRLFEAIPRLASGKVDYKTIVQAAHSNGDGREDRPSALDELAAMLARLSKKGILGEDASFRALGGDSLLYVQASILVEEALGELPEGWETMTLGQLRELEGRARHSPSSAPVPPRNIKFVQAMRSLAIMLVIAPHAMQTLTATKGLTKYFNFNHSSVVFLFVAGFLFRYIYKNISYVDYIKSKLKNNALPYVIISVPAMAIYLFGLKNIDKVAAPEWVQGKLMLSIYMLATGTHLGPLWFIPMIFIIFLAAPAFKLMDGHPRAFWLIPPILLLAFSVGRPIGDANPFQAFVFYVPYYLLGMWVSHYQEQTVPIFEKYWPVFAVPFFIMPFVSKGWPYAGYANVMAKASLALALLGVFSRYSSKAPRWFTQIGDMSFGIYLIHGYFASAIEIGTKKLGIPMEGLGAFAAAYTAIFVAAVASVIAARWVFGRYSRQIIGA